MSSGRRRAGAAAIAMLAAIACDRTPHGSTPLAVAVRIADLVPPSDVPGIARRADVILERDMREVLMRPAEGPALARLETNTPLRAYRVENVTPAMRAWGSVVIERTVRVDSRTTTPWWVPVDLTHDPTPRLLVAPTEKPEPVTMVKVYATPAPEHDFQVHRPYAPPYPYTSLFGAPPDENGPIESDFQTFRYEQEVRYADDHVRAFLEGLDALGLADHTLLVLTADHGEAFGEHGFFEHLRDVHDEMVHVPLVMRLPGVVPAGRRIAEPVSLVDILPTVLDVAGLPPVPDIDGTSLLPLLSGVTDRVARDGVFTQARSLGALEWFDVTSIRTPTHTCIHYARTGAVECYDRRVDPWERFAPLAPDAATADVRTARAALAQYVDAKPPLVPQLSWPEGLQGGAPDAASDVEERMQRLRTLGYVE